MSSYQVLARKWRPQQFSDMIGQEHVLRALINALDNQRIHHAYLFTGMRGVGKTTIARIFAKCLNCETNGVSSNPCGTCSACKDIDGGRFFDLIEVDAASRTKVDETRELLENVPYAPASGRYKVYLIDEVHMFSTHSFNALLKTLEEPPEHVKFLLATTDPQKVPVTVLSRCLQFNLKRMASTRLADYLSHILSAESMEHDKPALELIARAADGSVRDSLSLVEQASAFGGGEVRSADVESMLGRVSTDRLIDLLGAIGEADAKTLFEQVDALAEYSPDYVQITGELLSLLHRMAMLQSVPDSANEAIAGTDRLQELATTFSAEEIQLYYQIAQHARRDMPYSSDQREAFDMALLRMIAFAPQMDIPGATLQGATQAQPSAAASAAAPAAAKQSDAPVKPTATKVSPGRAQASNAAVKESVPAIATTQAPTAAPAEKKTKKISSAARELAAAAIAAANAPDTELPGKPGRGRVSAASTNPPAANSAQKDQAQKDQAQKDQAQKDQAQSSATQAKQTATAASSITSAAPSTAPAASPASPAKTVKPAVPEKPFEPVALESLNVDNWAATVTQLNLSGMPKQLAAQCVFHTREGTRLNLQLEEQQEHLNTPQFNARFQTAISEYTATDVTIEIEMVKTELNTPARVFQKGEDDAMAAAHVAINEDPLVKELLSGVDGVVDASSVRPVDNTNE